MSAPEGLAGAAAERPRDGHPAGATVWLTGLSGAGKSTIGDALVHRLHVEGFDHFRLDADDLRDGLCADLGFSEEDRVENVRRVGEVSLLFALRGHLSVVSIISPYAAGRAQVRARHDLAHTPFLEVHVATPLAVCEARDPKGLYRRAREGELASFTGVSAPYEAPTAPDVVLDASTCAPEDCAGELYGHLARRGLLRDRSPGGARMSRLGAFRVLARLRGTRRVEQPPARAQHPASSEETQLARPAGPDSEVVPTPDGATLSDEFDVVIVGGGPGGYAAALYGAAAGLSIAMVEKDKVGGTCLHRGCIPAKEFLETASVYRAVAGAKEFGIQAGQPTVDFSVSQDRKGKVVDQLFRGLTGLLKGRKVTVVPGTGELGPDKTVRVTGADGSVSELRGQHVVLASGSVPRTIPGFDPDGRLILTSDEVLDLSVLPHSVAVIGGGAIGCEFASMMADLGSQVTLLEVAPNILPGCDRDAADVVLKSFQRRGIVVRTGVAVHGHEPHDAGTAVLFGDGERVDVDAVVVSVGRRPLSDGLLTAGTGVELDERGFVRVDEWNRTTAADVFAIGDLVATPQLADVGFAEAILVVKQICGEPAVPIDYRNVAWCIYCHPEVAFVGYTEEAARAAGYDVVVQKDPYAGNGRARILGETDGLVKVIAERGPDGRAGRILGVHMVGPWVTEQLGQAYLSVNWEATPDEISQFIQPHPSLSETFGETVLALTGRGLHVG